MSNAENIKALRYTLGLSQADLGKKLGVDRSTVALWEKGTTVPRERYEKVIAEIFGDISSMSMPEKPVSRHKKKDKADYDNEEEMLKLLAKKRAEIERSFTVGKCYSISDTPNSSSFYSMNQFILQYERKEGIHHVFRETRGKWITTFTDAQLVGKFIKEVDKNGKEVAKNGNCKT